MKQRIPTLDSYIKENYIKEGNTSESFFSNMNVGQEAKTRAWLDRMEIKKYVINDDGTVDVNGNVHLDWKDLTKIEVQFRNVKGYFSISHNQLTSLEGVPESLGGDFSCSSNHLTSLDGAPKSVSGDFWCYANKLTSLDGAPKKVNGSFYCYSNNLTSLEGAPESVSGDFCCRDNKVKFTKEDVRKVCKVRGVIRIE